MSTVIHRRTKPIVAIDGGAGSGKTTVAAALAKQFQFTYISTGTIYRAVALFFLENNMDLGQEKELEMAKIKDKITFRFAGGETRIFLHGRDVSNEIHSREISNGASMVSSYARVRSALLDLQRNLGKAGGVIMDGRDIGTVVFPDAEVKVFLKASLRDRSIRRAKELEDRARASGHSLTVNIQEIEMEIQERDKRDSEREFAPLKKAHDAIAVDTSGITVQQVVGKIVPMVELKIKSME